MSLRSARAALLSRLPPMTVRTRLTLIFGGLFLPAAVVLLAITYGLVSSVGVHSASSAKASPPEAPAAVAPGGARGGGEVLEAHPGSVESVVSSQHVSDLHTLLGQSVVALAITVVLVIFLAWFLAGRVLRPLRAMTTATQQISEHNLHERLAMRGPRDELKALGDTIDGLLARLQGAFDAQRRFAANASHELRTPLTVSRALLEMTLADPNATVESFRAVSKQVLEEGQQQEQLIDALLVLARGQRALERREQLDLAAITREVVRAQQAPADVRVESSLMPASFSGDARLVQRLVANLLDNALRYNVAGGRARVEVSARDGRATLVVANTGPRVPDEEVQRLLRPFQRLEPERTGDHDGFGLGLSIVQAISDAHGAMLTARARPDGGLCVEVSFPPQSSSSSH